MDNELVGKVALVTGASRGIGREIAVALARAGADVAIHYRSQASQAEEVCSLIQGLGRRAVSLRADVSVAAEVSGLIASVEDHLGVVSILVNNAGIARPQKPEDVTERDWDEILTVNLKSCFLTTQAVLPGMRACRWGRIINLSSTAAQAGGIVGPHYTASKAGIQGLTHYYAALLAREGITVNAIAPALIMTDMLDALHEARPDRIPVGRFGAAEEVAAAAVLLACNGYLTGQTLQVNGGLYFT